MVPIIYDNATTDFSGNGAGFLHSCVSCVAEEERNGMYELTAEMYITDKQQAQLLIPGSFLKVKPNPLDDPQLFEIYHTTYHSDDTIEISAQHVRYITYNNIIEEAFISSLARTPSEWFDFIKSDLIVPYTGSFRSDITASGVITAGADRPIRLGDFFQGESGSMLDVFGGEFHFDNFDISLNTRRGRDTGICLRYGSCVSSHTQEADGQTMYTHFLPFAYVRAEAEGTGESQGERPVYHDVISLPNPTGMAHPRALSYDFSDDLRDEVMILYPNNTPKNYEELRQMLQSLATAYVNRNEGSLTNPTVNIRVDVADALQKLSTCGIGDTVLVSLGELTERVKIERTRYDCLRERYEEIELGAIKRRFADLFNTKNLGGA